MKYAIIVGDIVESISIGLPPYLNNKLAVFISDTEVVGPGFIYNPTSGGFTPPTVVAPPTPPTIDTSMLIDIGPFFDRFDNFTPGTKLAVLSNSDAIVQAIIKDVQSRKWVTLNRPDVAAAIDILISKGITGVNTTLKNYIISTPAAPEENLALRKLYLS